MNLVDEQAFFELAKKLEAERIASNEYIAVSPSSSIAEIDDEIEDEEWAIEKWLRLQNEEEEQKETSRRRLTAPPTEIRKRASKTPVKSIVSKVDELQARQIELVHQQINLQKILVENALIAQEEAKERLLLAKAQRASAELEHQQKLNNF